LAFRVLVSSSLTSFPFVLAARGCSFRFWTRAFVAFYFFLCVAWGPCRRLRLLVIAAYTDHRIWQVITHSL
jgi:hypothetical protein